MLCGLVAWFCICELYNGFVCVEVVIAFILVFGFALGVVFAFVFFAVCALLGTVPFLGVVDLYGGGAGQYFFFSFFRELHFFDLTGFLYSLRLVWWQPTFMFAVGGVWEIAVVVLSLVYMSGHEVVHWLSVGCAVVGVFFWVCFGYLYVFFFFVLP
ncbi:hypothetical protein SAMN04488032_103258 [Pacificibacter marinus]|nr:hypothetical protein SAMN04488032_103258 [Pacificibacter marinus]